MTFRYELAINGSDFMCSGGSSPQICYHRQAKCQSNSSDSVVTQKALHRSSKNEKRSTIDSRAGGGQPILAVEAEAAKVVEPSSSSLPKYLMTTSKASSLSLHAGPSFESCISSSPSMAAVEAAAMPPAAVTKSRAVAMRSNDLSATLEAIENSTISRQTLSDTNDGRCTTWDVY